MSIFSKKGYITKVIRDEHEPLEHFNERGYFIVSQKPKTRKEYEMAVLYSRIYINKLHKGCGYNRDVEKRLESMLKNL